MTRFGFVTAALASLALGAAPAAAQTMRQHMGMAAEPHVTVMPDHLKWMAQPPGLPPGGEVAVVSGDPGKPGPYVVRARLPAGYKVLPHTHPGDEHITVLSGSFHFGMGTSFDMAKGMALPAGSFVLAPKGMAHYVWFSEPSVIQIHGVGPFDITYVNPADDPRRMAGK